MINTGYNDQHPAISKDGLSLYFTSNRSGGYGADDLWVSQRASLDDPWGPPQNLGPTINTGAVEFSPAFSRDGHWLLFEGAPALSSDGETLFFYSNRPGGFGANDLYMSTRHKLHGNDQSSATSASSLPE